MIIIIRGTNGSGKTHAMRTILSKSEFCRFVEYESQIVRLPKISQPIVIVGPYSDGRSMGGCDCIRQPSRIYETIMWAENRSHHVLLEGVVLATKPYLDLFKRGHDVRYVLLDPGLKECLRRIKERQEKKGHASPLSLPAMKRKLERARNMYADASWLDMPILKTVDASVAVNWIIKQLRSE